MLNLQTLKLPASDSFYFDAYVATPDSTPKGGVVILQEIFGITSHIKDVLNEYAKEGYLSIAPALFDRVKKGVDLPYSAFEEGRSYLLQCDMENIIKDISAAIDYVSDAGKVHVIGYCWGGALAYLSACKLAPCTAISYYGTRTLDMLDLKPQCPVMFHFGEQDKGLPPEAVEKIALANPNAPCYVYPGAAHGFNCTDRDAYNPDAATLAKKRSLDFMQRYSAE